LGRREPRLAQPESPPTFSRGRFLVVGSRDDAFVPEAAEQRMRDLAPVPKTIFLLKGGHKGAGADRQAPLAEIIAVTTRCVADE